MKYLHLINISEWYIFSDIFNLFYRSVVFRPVKTTLNTIDNNKIIDDNLIHQRPNKS